ncbi:MAG TPA: hypothetical protein DDY49_07070 [Paenibacillaceae bacterium]|nr:hypothetical protein [Paenibacillaceae bacterium]
MEGYILTKAEELSPVDLIKFNLEKGEIRFKDRRMVLSSADAWGMLRKDLIAALGLERAKSFLVRYGWNCGINDARNLKEMFEWDNDNELLLAGLRMHNISGSVMARFLEMEIDCAKGHFYFLGEWINSHEAEQHLLHFPSHHEPVCYILMGYAGGYSTEFLGKKVIVKEIECVAAGAKSCRFIGKTIDQWGDEIIPDLPFYEERSMADELDIAYRRIEEQAETLKRSAKLNQKLTQIVLQGKGLDAIARVVAENLGCGISIFDKTYQPLSVYGDLDFSRSRTFSEIEKNVLEKVNKERRTMEIGNRLISPIVLQNQVSGFVSLYKKDGCFANLETVSLERMATVCAIQMLNEKTAIESEQRAKGELLDELLMAEIDTDRVRQRMTYFGYGINTSYSVFVFQIKENSHWEKEGAHDERKEIVNIISSDLEHAGYHALVSSRIDRVFALIPEKLFKMKKINCKEYGQFLIDKINDLLKNSRITLGMSGIYHDLCSFSRGFHEAQKAIEIAEMKWKNRQVVHAAELGHLGLLLNARNPEELESFAKEKVGTIYEYDKKSGGELLKTLYYYIKNEFNLHKTAREMNITIGGMRYRLRRIQELGEFDLNNSDTRFEIQLALEISVVMGQLKV